MPKISVLMPVYKTPEKYLREAIESILNQTFTDFEFLILDDCPEDNRKDIVFSYHDKRIKYFQNKQNMGISASRNKLLDLAQGEYLAVMDHDDICLPKRFEKEVQYLDEHPKTGVVSSQVKRIISKKITQNPTDDKEIKLALMRVSVMAHPAAMIRKSVLIDNKIRYEEQYSPAEDYALWCRLIPYTDFHNLEDILLLYRDHNQNTSHLQSAKMKKATLSIWAFVENENPILYKDFSSKARKKSYVKLFGIIPFLSVIKQGDNSKFYLFEKIPILSIKQTFKLKGK
ncbi:MAG: glycosyltransferase family 2 protein [Alphaproteobacteria bacterium]|nr:glycosyltransferase family 2 protein [Alphaproteobacteria bacterium]